MRQAEDESQLAEDLKISMEMLDPQVISLKSDEKLPKSSCKLLQQYWKHCVESLGDASIPLTFKKLRLAVNELVSSAKKQCML